MYKNRTVIYRVVQSNNTLFESDSIDVALHEYLNILKEHILFCFANNFSPSNSNSDSLYVTTVSYHQGKLYPIYMEKYYIDFNSFNLWASVNNQPPEVVTQSYFICKITESLKRLLETHSTNKNNHTLIDSKHQYRDKTLNWLNQQHKPHNSIPTEPSTIPVLTQNKQSTELSKPSIIIEKIQNKELDKAKIINETKQDISEDLSEEQIKQELDRLIKIRETKLDTIFKLQDKKELEQENYTNVLCDINTAKMKNKLIKEKLEREKRKYDGAKSTYNKIKSDLNLPSTDRPFDESNIPILFADKYPIFKFMDENNLLNTANEFEIYYDMYTALVDENCPDDEKLNIEPNVDQETRKLVDDFIINNQDTYPSVDKLLEEQEEKNRSTNVNNPSQEQPTSIFKQNNINLSKIKDLMSGNI